MASQDWLTKDFYKALEVDKNADDATIKKAYRRLARTYHPDRNPGDKVAEDRFKEVGEAYQVLSNPEDRKQYDAIRAMGSGGPRFAPGGGGGFEDVFSSMFGGGGAPNSGGFGGGNAGGFEDIFSGMFGGGGTNTRGGFGGFGRKRPTKGSDLTATTSIPLKDAVAGTTVQVTVNGKRITARVPAGVTDGKKIRLRGKGGPGQNGGEKGDLLITVQVEKHPVFSLDGMNVRLELPISFPEAALGTQVDVPTVDGNKVTMKIPAGSSSGSTLRIRGKGVDTGSKKGDMLVTLKIVVPRKLADDAKEAVEAFAEVTKDANPRYNFDQMAGM